MADSTLTVQGIVLYEHTWPGTPVTPPVDYSDMTAAAVGHNLAAALWPLGTKWQVYCHGNAASVGVGYNVGWSTFTYLLGADNIASAVAGVVTVIGVPDNTLAAGDIPSKYYTIVCDSDQTTHEGSGRVAVCLSTMTNSYYGWFWTGGICPIEYVPGMTTASTLVTDDSVTAGCEVITVASAATGIALKIATAGIPACGYALYADGA